VTFVAGNKKKLEEVPGILKHRSDLPYALENRKIDLPELQGDDPAIVAKEKCQLDAEDVNGAVIIEDISLCFAALNNLPGLYIKWFLDKNGLN